MKSRQVIWLLLIYCLLNLPQVLHAKDLTNETKPKKVFILLRTEQQADVLDKFKSQIQNNLHYNHVKVKILSYGVSEAIPQMRIFKTAYQNNYDYILLIDHVANFNVGISDSQVHVGGKFRIQSYNLKSQVPAWTNHGNKSCNVSVVDSVHAFSKEILNSIAPNMASDFIAYNLDQSNSVDEEEIYVNSTNQLIEEIVIPGFKLKKIQLLQSQLKLQQAKTLNVLSHIEILHQKIQFRNQLAADKSEKLALKLEKI